MAQIVECRSSKDFESANELLAEMAAWDAASASAMGYSGDNVLSSYYNETVETLMAKFGERRGVFYLADLQGDAVGCLGFLRFDRYTAEIEKLFVRPGARGSNLGRTLMAAALNEIALRRFSRVRLVTASFMDSAVSLYRSFGFAPCEPFHKTPAGLESITIYMQRAIAA